MAVTSLRGTAGARVRRAVAARPVPGPPPRSGRPGRPAGFDVRLMVSAVATVVLVIAIIGRPSRPAYDRSITRPLPAVRNAGCGTAPVLARLAEETRPAPRGVRSPGPGGYGP